MIVLSDDESLINAITAHLEAVLGSLEVQVLRDFASFAEHLRNVRPDLTVIDTSVHTSPLDNVAVTVKDFAQHGLFAHAPTVWLASQEIPNEKQQALHHGAIGYLIKTPGYVDSIVELLLESRQAAGMHGRIEETEQHYHDILEASSDGIFVLVGNTFRYLNGSFARSLGLESAAIVGRVGLLDVVVPEEREKVGEELARLQVSGGVREVLDMTLRGSDHRHIAFEVACRSSVVEGKRALVGVARDVTAVRELQDEIERARQRAAQVERLRTLGEMAAGVAHDFNNALSTILGRLGLVRERLHKGLDVDDDLDIIEVAAQSASETARRIQEFSKPVGGDTWYDVNLQSIAQDAANFVRTQVPPEITFQGEFDSTPTIRGNGAELREVLLNLLNNSIDASAAGGTVTLRTFTDGKQAVVEVTDTGCGMPEHIQQRIFEPFFSTKEEKGTGLGLSVSHWILRRHDAQIDLQSSPGKGTRFRLSFTPFSPSPSHTAPVSGSRLTVVVVDDDVAVAEMVSDILSEQGHVVTIVNNPSEAARALGKQAVDLLITDLDLPGMSGWQLARRVRDIHPNILVGLITGWPVGASDAELQARGVNFVLPKPFTLEALYAALDSARRN